MSDRIICQVCGDETNSAPEGTPEAWQGHCPICVLIGETVGAIVRALVEHEGLSQEEAIERAKALIRSHEGELVSFIASCMMEAKRMTAGGFNVVGVDTESKCVNIEVIQCLN